jgi:thiamine kinase-like enzyme
VRVPTSYAAFSDSTLRAKPMHFIVMERIEGETLRAHDWMSMGDKPRIMSRLCEQYKLLRSIPSEGYYGRVQRQGWRSWPSFLRKMDPESSGPFDTYEEFVAALCSSARLCTAMMCGLPDFTDRESLYLQEMESTFPACNERQPVFTHLDPQLRNTIVRRIPGLEGEEDWEVTLIDWEHSGWFPAWMQAWAFEEKLEMMTITVGKVNRGFTNVSRTEEETVHFITRL